MHCGDASDVKYLDHVWKASMKRPDAPPLKIVVDDGSHLSKHMAQSVFFWFPKIEPRGMLIVEDIQPISDANAFRTQFLPQIMKGEIKYIHSPLSCFAGSCSISPYFFMNKICIIAAIRDKPPMTCASQFCSRC